MIYGTKINKFLDSIFPSLFIFKALATCHILATFQKILWKPKRAKAGNKIIFTKWFQVFKQCGGFTKDWCP